MHACMHASIYLSIYLSTYLSISFEATQGINSLKPKLTNVPVYLSQHMYSQRQTTQNKMVSLLEMLERTC